MPCTQGHQGDTAHAPSLNSKEELIPFTQRVVYFFCFFFSLRAVDDERRECVVVAARSQQLEQVGDGKVQLEVNVTASEDDCAQVLGDVLRDDRGYVGVHGKRHDGALFESRQLFRQFLRAQPRVEELASSTPVFMPARYFLTLSVLSLLAYCTMTA